MHHSDDTSEATQATQDERLRKYRLSESPRPNTSPRQILEVLCLYNQEFLYGKAKLSRPIPSGHRAISRWRGLHHFPARRLAIGATPEALFYCRLLPPREIAKAF
jgi:hypothetical protein